MRTNPEFEAGPVRSPGAASGGARTAAARWQSEFDWWGWSDPEAHETDFEWMDEVSRSSPE